MTLPRQIKEDGRLVVRWEPAPFTLEPAGAVTLLSIDGRALPIAAPAGAPIDEVARAVARVPADLRGVLTAIDISPIPNPSDAAWGKKYRLPVRSGMGAVASGTGKVVIYPHGLEQLPVANGDSFVRGLMHELGHCWSLREWKRVPSAKEAWMTAMGTDATAPSQYALLSFRNSGWPHEDAAEATALYFLVRGTSAFETHRASMPGRFALLRARFPNDNAVFAS